MIARGLAAAVSVAFIAGCGAHRFVLPAGTGLPAPEGPSAFADATSQCRSVRVFSGELRLSGHAGLRRLRGTIQAAVTSDGQIFLEMPAPFGQPVFVLAGSMDRTTLLLPRDARHVVARAEDILEALIGVKLDPRLLLELLAGCGGREHEMTGATRYGDGLAVSTAEGRIFLEKRQTRWQVVAAETAGVLVEYPDAARETPHRLRVTSLAGRVPAIDLSISASQIELNTSFPAATFAVTVPAGSAPLALEELRAGGPLGEKAR